MQDSFFLRIPPLRFSSQHPSSLWLRFLKELPLALVCLILVWAHYSLVISLVCQYLISIRRLHSLSAAIVLSFEVCWCLAVSSLARCVLSGPGWVSMAQLNSEGFSSADEESGRRPAKSPNPLHPRRQHPQYCDQVYDQEEVLLPLRSMSSRRSSTSDSDAEDNGLLRAARVEEQMELGPAPRLRRDPLPPNPSGSQTRPRTSLCLSPRSSTAGPLPPYPLRASQLPPPSALTFTEQVRRHQGRSPVHLVPAALLSQSPPEPPFSPLASENLQNLKTLMCKSDGSRRFCRKCNVFKADRAHHCSSCGRCVLKMDHHCPWLGGRCVGLYNHKFFVLFLVWSSVTSIVCLLASFKGLMDFVSTVHPVNGPQFQLAPLNWTFLVLLGGLFGMVLTGFTCFHLYLISVNRTTIENMERSVRVRPTLNSQTSYALLRTASTTKQRIQTSDTPLGLQGAASLGEESPSYHLPIYKSDDRLTRIERRKLESGSTKLNVYDLGSKLENFRQVFGVHSFWWEWVLPIRPRGVCDGYCYRINEEHLNKLRELTAEVRLLSPERANELRYERPC